VRLDLNDASALRQAVAEIEAAVPLASQLLLQPMVAGTELVVGSVQDPQVGPMIMLGAGGVLIDILDDRTFRLAPLTHADAHAMISSLRTARLLDGHRTRPVVSRSAISDILVRVAQLASDLPDVAELDLSPLIGRGDRVVAVDARVRIHRAIAKSDPLSRQLRAATLSKTGAHHDK
jgi:acyl-CoA synthetase (NDP forming)